MKLTVATNCIGSVATRRAKWTSLLGALLPLATVMTLPAQTIYPIVIVPYQPPPSATSQISTVVGTRDSGPFFSAGNFILKIRNKSEAAVQGISYQVTTMNGNSPVATAPSVPAGHTVEVSGNTEGLTNIVVFGDPDTLVNDVDLNVAYQPPPSSITPSTSVTYRNIPEPDMIPGLALLTSGQLTRMTQPMGPTSTPLENTTGVAMLGLHNGTTKGQTVTYGIYNDTGVATTKGTLTVPAGGLTYMPLTTPSDFSLQLTAVGVQPSLTLGGVSGSSGQTLTGPQMGFGPYAATEFGICYDKAGCPSGSESAWSVTKDACNASGGKGWKGPVTGCVKP